MTRVAIFPDEDIEMTVPEQVEVTKGGKIICVTAVGLPSISQAFTSVEFVPEHSGIDRIERLSPDDDVDAVFFYHPRLTTRFYALLKYASEVAHELSIPLVVSTADCTEDIKYDILKHGADDCLQGEINWSELACWIKFLRESKLMLRADASSSQPVETENNFEISPLKRLFDILVSAAALIFLSPIMLVIAVVIKLDSKGPIFYISKRAGSGYKVFNFLKFRTMKTGSDADLAKLQHLNQYTNGSETAKSVFVKLSNDPRVTRVGKFLRNTSLDELPQLINVLKGDMSIVGNRPLPLYEAQQLTKDQCAMRFMAAAGITGLWQVTKRGKKEISDEERIALDVEYARSNSFQNDIVLIVKTLPALTQEVAV